jgi:hypothetical protein
MYPLPPPNTFVASVETFTSRMMWPLGKLSKASPTPKGEYKQFLRMVPVRPTLAYASGIASPIATRDAGGPKK